METVLRLKLVKWTTRVYHSGLHAHSQKPRTQEQLGEAQEFVAELAEPGWKRTGVVERDQDVLDDPNQPEKKL
jgi:hypothetical protein